MKDLPEPWLRGAMPGVDPFVAPVFCAFQQAREDVAMHIEGLTTERIWATPHGFGSVGFHLRHIAGSTDRLITYIEGKDLSDAQLAALAAEHDRGATGDELLGVWMWPSDGRRSSSALWIRCACLSPEPSAANACPPPSLVSWCTSRNTRSGTSGRRSAQPG